jgi:hypothetical protein
VDLSCALQFREAAYDFTCESCDGRKRDRSLVDNRGVAYCWRVTLGGGNMEITYENVMRFARDNGDVTVNDSRGKSRLLQNGEWDSFDLLEKADAFLFKEKWYNRIDFQKVLDDASNQKNP